MEFPHYSLEIAAQKIRSWKKEAGLKGKDVAKMARISAAYFSDISKGKQRGSIEVLARISAVFGRKVDDLFEVPPKAAEDDEDRHLRAVDASELGQQLHPILGERTDDFVQCFQLWVKAPRALREALQVFQREADRAARGF